MLPGGRLLAFVRHSPRVCYPWSERASPCVESSAVPGMNEEFSGCGAHPGYLEPRMHAAQGTLTLMGRK